MRSTRRYAMTLARASGIAAGLGSLSIDIDHLVVAMIEYPRSNANLILEAVRDQGTDVSEAVESRYRKRGSSFLVGSIPYSDAARRAIDACETLSRSDADLIVTSGHLLMKIAEVADDDQTSRIAAYGIDLTRVPEHEAQLRQSDE